MDLHHRLVGSLRELLPTSPPGQNHKFGNATVHKARNDAQGATARHAFPLRRVNELEPLANCSCELESYGLRSPRTNPFKFAIARPLWNFTLAGVIGPVRAITGELHRRH